MKRKAGMIHAMCSNAQLFKKLISEIMPETDVVHLIDEGLPAMSDKSLHKRVVRRLGALALSAKDSDAEIVLLTCTAFGRLADEVQAIAKIPVLSVLEIVADEAVRLGDQIGLLASHPGTLATAAELIKEQAALKGKRVELKTVLCQGAFEALKQEDWPTHDRIVLRYLEEVGSVEVVVIPQPSIERVVDQLPEASRKVPILSSGRLSVKRLKERLDAISPPT